MKKSLLLFITVLICTYANVASAQCGIGTTRCSINWDFLDFFPSAGLGTYTTLANSQTQNFAFGTQSLRINHNYTGSNAVGEDALNTAEVGSNGTGADIHFIGNGQITYTFQNPVNDIRFSIYDIDRNQRVTISSTGALVTLTRMTGSILSLSGSGTASAQATASSSVVDNTDDNGTLNVAITSLTSITSFTITVTLTGTNSSPVENGDFWVSDLNACSAGSFSSTYFQVSRPFTNQAGYVITSRDNSFYYVDPTTGTAKFIFTDPGHTNVNSVAYDPVKHYIYYTYSLTTPGPPATSNPANKTLRRYSYDRDTFGIVMNDITSLIPTFEAGVESGAAAFYDGSLYLGIEARHGGTNETIVWKVDFNASDVPVSASQVFALPGTNHDWGDIAVANGTLYDFDARPGVENFYHMDLITKNVTTHTPTGTNVPRQAAVDWNNNVFNLGSPNVANPPGEIAPYNLNGTVNTAAIRTITENGATLTGSWGDGGEAFKPRVDYGDAPASFDPGSGDPAVHEISNLLRFGNSSDNEWLTRGQTALANSDNHDDGIILGSLVNPSAGTFFAQVRYLNNTGTTATICAWVDFNNNGRFDAIEGLSQTNLPSSASMQTAYFNWSGVSTTLTDGSYTYLRLRITTTANAMTTANPTGFFNIGEVEDHRLIVTINPLDTKLVNFDAVKQSNKVAINWQVTNEVANTNYTIQRSKDGNTWTDIHTRQVLEAKAANSFSYVDSLPLKGVSYYRLKIQSSASVYSSTRKIEFSTLSKILVSPNPASTSVTVSLTTARPDVLSIQIHDATGREIKMMDAALTLGFNKIPVDLSGASNGIYWVQFFVGNERYVERILIRK